VPVEPPNRPENAPPPKPADVTPFAVAETDVALTVPFLAVGPSTVTVSPGFKDDSDEAALRSMVVVELIFTGTSAPLELVTYRVLPMMSVTVPDVTCDDAEEAPVLALEPVAAKPAANRPASEDADVTVDDG